MISSPSVLEFLTKDSTSGLKAIINRLRNSSVAWTLAFNCLRLALGILLLPVLLRVLSAPDLGMYYLFLNLNAIVVVLDVGFSPTLGRFINYAMGGAERLTAQGLAEGGVTGAPNYTLLWDLLLTARLFYRYLALGMILLLGSFGSWIVWVKVAETSFPRLTWAAWAVSILAVAAETYFNFWNTYLRNMDRVLPAVRISMLAYALRLAMAVGLLLVGAGLLSLPIASLVTSVLIRNLSRRECLKVLAPHPPPEHVDWRAYFHIIWPNSWRLGLYFAGIYLSINVNGLLCSTVLGLAANASYGLSLQIFNIVTGVAAVWPWVKWPLVGQLIARREIEPLQRVLWPRVWLQVITFVALSAGAIWLGPPLIHFFGRDKEILPLGWLLLLVFADLLETHLCTWCTFITLWNELPMLWPSLATNAVSLFLNLALVHLPGASPGVLIIGPLAASLAFNYWFWPRYATRVLGLSWPQFMIHGFGRRTGDTLSLAAK